MSALAEAFGRRVRKARLARGWTIRELADKSGLSHSSANKIQRGYHEPVLGHAVAIANALGLSLDALTAPSRCEVCDGMPPAGMRCRSCGTEGPAVAR